MGISGKLYEWLQGFLLSRKQTVMVDGVVSERVSVVSGVPQGSVIGPLMFLILLRDIDADIAFANVSSFADDTRVCSGIRSLEDVTRLQADLNKIYEWARKNNAIFNPDKFECVRYGVDETMKQSTSYKACNGLPIQCSEHVRDLGVKVSHDATFTQHIRDLTMAASLKCSWILRVFKSRDRVPLMILWKSLVASILEYCCQL